MKFMIARDTLRKMMTTVNAAVPGKTSLPVLQNVLLVAKNSKLIATASDLEIAVTTEGDATVTVEGSITLPARLLSDLVSILPSHDVFFDVDNLVATVVCDKFSNNIHGLPAEDYPQLPKFPTTEEISVDAVLFRGALMQTVPAVATDDSRPVLSGILMTIADDKMELAAADGFRLAHRSLETLSPDASTTSVLIPGKTVNHLIKAINNTPNGSTVSIFVDANTIRFSMMGAEIISRLIDGKFPDLKRVIPAVHNTSATVNVSELLRAVKIASLLTDANRISVYIANTGLHITASGNTRGISASEVLAEVTGDPMTIILNGQFLTDALTACNCTTVRMETQSTNAPAVFRPVDPSGAQEYIHIVMPMSAK